MKIIVTEIEATVEDLRTNRTLGDALTSFVYMLSGRFASRMEREEEQEEEEEERPE